MIDIRAYDQAMFHRFRKHYDHTYWSTRPNLVISDIRDSRIYEGSDIVFPAIVVRRTEAPFLFRDENTRSRYETGMCDAGKERTIVFSKFVLKYMVEVFSFERDNFDTLVVELQENLIRSPFFSFDDSDDPDIPGISTEILMDDGTDNTDLEAMTSETPFYRASIPLTVYATIYRKYEVLRVDSFVVEAETDGEVVYSTEII